MTTYSALIELKLAELITGRCDVNSVIAAMKDSDLAFNQTTQYEVIRALKKWCFTKRGLEYRTKPMYRLIRACDNARIRAVLNEARR